MATHSSIAGTMGSESETERKPEVPASTRDEALFHCTTPSGGWSCPEGLRGVANQDGKWQELGTNIPSNTEIWRHLSACPGLLSFGTLDG